VVILWVEAAGSNNLDTYGDEKVRGLKEFWRPLAETAACAQDSCGGTKV